VYAVSAAACAIEVGVSVAGSAESPITALVTVAPPPTPNFASLSFEAQAFTASRVEGYGNYWMNTWLAAVVPGM
jgi:hypothetical protein